MRDIYVKILESFEMNRFSVLVTLIGQSGSAPRSVGTKLLVLEDGSFVGTIGGGLLEMAVLERSKKVFAYGLPLRFNYSLHGTDIADTDMLCGGEVELFLEPVSPDNVNYLHIFKDIIDIIRRGGSGLLATVVDAEQWQTGQIPKLSKT